ncbi:hypothetical protein CB0940_09192 [Cercospora beticola]|uniref:Cell wall protein n=1 Tax=Cercospora beticola TaxID=122368 RepID=A0A2G5HHU6_CERBT|nr:hypothetical protein CB0940_09192 [Cercospora beticola]PIA91773.1 hypothetical protein CB0940_09192 [Cercospora beticola]WPB06514.1 hypothetical protein RHO25_011171 [Cercospora beticola]CAK1366422.1 unnamed protein product [Cercospora beticola]
MHFIKSMVLASLAAATSAQVTASKITQGLSDINAKSSEAATIADNVSPTNVFSEAPKLVNSMKELIDLETTQVAALQNRKRALKIRQTVPDVPEECLNLPEPELQECIDDLVPSSSSTTLQARQASSAFSTADQQEVCEAFDVYAADSTKMLESLNAQAKFLRQSTPFAPPIAAALRLIENSSDALAFSIVERIPDCAEGVKASQDKYARFLKTVLAAYE